MKRRLLAAAGCHRRQPPARVDEAGGVGHRGLCARLTIVNQSITESSWIQCSEIKQVTIVSTPI